MPARARVYVCVCVCISDIVCETKIYSLKSLTKDINQSQLRRIIDN